MYKVALVLGFFSGFLPAERMNLIVVPDDEFMFIGVTKDYFVGCGGVQSGFLFGATFLVCRYLQSDSCGMR